MSHVAMQEVYKSIDEHGWRCLLENAADMSDHAMVYLLDLRDSESPQFIRDVFIVPDEAFAKGEYTMAVPEDEDMPAAEYFGQVTLALADRLTQAYDQPNENFDEIKNALVGLNICLANFLANANQEPSAERADGTYNHYVLVFSKEGLGAHGLQTDTPVIAPDQLSEAVHSLMN